MLTRPCETEKLRYYTQCRAFFLLLMLFCRTILFLYLCFAVEIQTDLLLLMQELVSPFISSAVAQTVKVGI